MQPYLGPLAASNMLQLHEEIHQEGHAMYAVLFKQLLTDLVNTMRQMQTAIQSSWNSYRPP
jgi:hypothetical protein